MLQTTRSFFRTGVGEVNVRAAARAVEVRWGWVAWGMVWAWGWWTQPGWRVVGEERIYDSMTGWVHRTGTLMFELLFEKLIVQVFWRWPKSLVAWLISKRSSARDTSTLIANETHQPGGEHAERLVTPAAAGPQHDPSSYRLRRVGGAYVYEFHADPEDGHDSCWACQRCFDDGRISLLQPDPGSVEVYHPCMWWLCSHCDQGYLINQHDGPPDW